MAEWFPHDYNARNDAKMTELRIELGHAGVGMFWDAVEILHEQGGSIGYDRLVKILAHESGSHADRATCANALQVMMHLHLLCINDDNDVYSERAERNIKDREKISGKRRRSAKSRWDKAHTSDANAMQMQSNSNASAMPIHNNTVHNSTVQDSKSKSAPSLDDVVNVFRRDGFDATVAQAFHDHYTAQGWMSGNGQRIVNWQAKAKRWMVEEAQRKRKEQNTNTQRKQQRGLQQLGANAEAIRRSIDAVQRGGLALPTATAHIGGEEHRDPAGEGSLLRDGDTGAG